MSEEMCGGLADALDMMFDMRLDEHSSDAGAFEAASFGVFVALKCEEPYGVFLVCPSSLASAAAGAALGLCPDETSAYDRLDAAREIANVIAGRLQGACFSHTELCLPQMTSVNEIIALADKGAVLAEHVATYKGAKALVVVSKMQNFGLAEPFEGQAS
ncbi:MAG: hypothetical protein AAGC95_03645 [Pseudomonadota bacterium]